MVKESKHKREQTGFLMIMLNALSAEKDKLAALTIGIDDYLSEPFSLSILLARA